MGNLTEQPHLGFSGLRRKHLLVGVSHVTSWVSVCVTVCPLTLLPWSPSAVLINSTRSGEMSGSARMGGISAPDMSHMTLHLTSSTV